MSKTGTAYRLQASRYTPAFLMDVRVAHRFSFLCCNFCFALSSFCVLCLMLSVSLDSILIVLVFCVINSVVFVFVLCLMSNVVCVSGFYLHCLIFCVVTSVLLVFDLCLVSNVVCLWILPSLF